MVRLRFIKTKIFLVLWFIQVVPLFASTCLYSKKLNSVSCSHSNPGSQISVIEPAFIAYRLAVKGSSERKCRLEPTCSKFLIHAIKYHGLPKGILFSFARSQIRHDDGFGLLPKFINSDGFLYILDPVSNWEFK